MKVTLNFPIYLKISHYLTNSHDIKLAPAWLKPLDLVPTWSAYLSKRSLTEWSLEQNNIFDQDVDRRRQQEARRHHGQEDLGVHSGKDEAAEEQVEEATGLWCTAENLAGSEPGLLDLSLIQMMLKRWKNAISFIQR